MPNQPPHLLPLLIAGTAWLPAATPPTLLLDNANSPMQAGIDVNADWTPGRPSVDLWFKARSWVFQKDNSTWGQGTSDGYAFRRDGYPSAMPGGTAFLESVLLPGSHGAFPGGAYRFLYDGTGTLKIKGIGGTFTATPAHTVSIPSSLSYLSVQLHATDPADPVRNIRFVPVERLDDYRSGTTSLTPEWRDDAKRYRVLRFMDWFHTNSNTSVKTLLDGRKLDPSALRTWDLRAAPEDAFQSGTLGVAYEHAARVCNALMSDCWICVPHNADDDYITRMAEVFKAQLDPRLRVWVEYSNETWNAGGPFRGQFDWCTAKAKSQISTTAFNHHYHAKRSLEMWKLWEDVFGHDRRIVRVMSGQTVSKWTYEQRLDVAVPVTYKGGTVIPRSRVDCLAATNYFGGDIGSATIAARIFDGSTADGWMQAAYKDVANPRWGDSFGGSGSGTGLLGVAKSLPIVAYEGGLAWEMNLASRIQAIKNLSSSDDDTATLTQWTDAMIAAAGKAEQYQLHKDYWDAWMALDPAKVFMLSQFTDSGGWTKYGCWGLSNRFTPLSTVNRLDALHRQRALNEWIDSHRVANQPADPVHAKSVWTAAIGKPIRLAAMVSDDGARQIGRVHHVWMAHSGPAAASIADAETLAPTFTAPAAGTYTVRLYANDGWTISYRDTAIIVSSGAKAELDVERDAAPIADDGADALPNSRAGQPRTLAYDLINQGDLALDVAGISVTGTSNANASLSGFTGGSIPASQSRTLQVQVTPTAAGAWATSVRILNTDGDEGTYDWAISGTANAASSVLNTAPGLTLSGTAPDDAVSVSIIDLDGTRAATLSGTAPGRLWTASTSATAGPVTIRFTAPDGSTSEREFGLGMP